MDFEQSLVSDEELSQYDVSMQSNKSCLNSSTHLHADKRTVTVVAEDISCEGMSPLNESLEFNESCEKSLENSAVQVIFFLIIYALIIFYLKCLFFRKTRNIIIWQQLVVFLRKIHLSDCF